MGRVLRHRAIGCDDHTAQMCFVDFNIANFGDFGGLLVPD